MLTAVILLMCGGLAVGDNSFLEWKGVLPNPYLYNGITGAVPGIAPGFTETKQIGGGRSVVDYDDTTAAIDLGKAFDWTSSGWSFDMFGTPITSITCFDVGYCDDSADLSGHVTPPGFVNSADLFFAPYWVSDEAYSYNMYIQMFESVLSGNPGPNQHLCEIVTYIVRTAESNSQIDSKWKCDNLIVVTWSISAGGEEDVFQLVLADSSSGDYLIFLYNELTLTPTTFLLGFANGAASGEVAALCEQTVTNVHNSSNRYCSQPGHYVFDVAAGEECDAPTVCATGPTVTNWEDSTPNRNCLAQLPPVDTCTETAECYIEPTDTTKVRITLRTRGYSDASHYAQFLGYNTYEPVTDPGCTERTLPLASTTPLPNTVGDELEQLITLPAAGGTATKCGMLLTETERTIQYAYKVYQNYTLGTIWSVNLAEWDSYIVNGTCTYLSNSINQTAEFKDISSTAVPARTRDLVLNFELEQHAGASTVQPGSAVMLGRSLWVSLCYTPDPLLYNAYADPYGAYIKDCWMSNNAAFNHDGITEFSIQVVSSGCASLAVPGVGQAFHLSSDFIHDAAFNADTSANGIGPAWTAGEEFCQISGFFRAAKIPPSDDMYMKCSSLFCKNNDNFTSSTCVDSCTGTAIDRRKRNADDYDEEIVETFLHVIDPEESEEAKSTSQCVDNTVAMATIGSLITAIIVATIGTAALFAVYHNRKLKLGL